MATPTAHSPSCLLPLDGPCPFPLAPRNPDCDTHDQPTQKGLIIDPQWTLEAIETKVIDWTLERFDGNRQATAKHLGIGVRTLYRRLNDDPHSDL